MIKIGDKEIQQLGASVKILVVDCSESSQRNIEMGFYCYSFYCFFFSFYFIYFILVFYHFPTQNFLMASHWSIIRPQLFNLAQKATVHLVPVHTDGPTLFYILLCFLFSPQDFTHALTGILHPHLHLVGSLSIFSS